MQGLDLEILSENQGSLLHKACTGSEWTKADVNPNSAETWATVNCVEQASSLTTNHSSAQTASFYLAHTANPSSPQRQLCLLLRRGGRNLESFNYANQCGNTVSKDSRGDH